MENSNIAPGCVDYNLSFKVSRAESNVRRVLLLPVNADKFVVGSNVSVGSTKFARVTSKSTVSVSGTTYGVLNLDLDSPITTTTSQYVSTLPWNTGSTESVSGHGDGSPYSLSSGKYPLRVAGIEVLIGCSFFGLDVLYSTTSSGYFYCYECNNSANYSSSLTGNYVNSSLRSCANNTTDGIYIKSYNITSKPVLVPASIGGTATTYLQSVFSGISSSKTCCSVRYGSLSLGASAGLSYFGYYQSNVAGTSSIAPILAGAEKIRGELSSLD